MPPLTRRTLLGAGARGLGLLGGAAAVGALPRAVTAPLPAILRRRPRLDALQVGVIGIGNRGRGHLNSLGYAGKGARRDRQNDPIDGVEVVAVCDTFEDHLDLGVERVRDAGRTPARYVDYRKMLEREDLDAVVVATPDHAHAPIAIAAARAGCDVYVEKCMTNTIDEALELGRVLADTERILQCGYQLRQDGIHRQAREHVRRGYLGDVHMVEVVLRRSGNNAAWRKPIAENGGPPREKVHWEQFLMNAPKREYDPERYFEWRRFWDYGTGIAGDILSHVLDAASMVLDLGIPSSAVAAGGIYHWKDGRETPDTYTSVLQYDDRDTAVSFNCTMSNAFQDQATLYLGSEATMRLTWKLQIFPDLNSEKYRRGLDSGKLKNTKPMIVIEDAAAGRMRSAAPSEAWLEGRGMTDTMRDGVEHDTTRLHHTEFFECVRARRQPSAGYPTALASTIGAHLSHLAYVGGRRVTWNAEEHRAG